MRINVQEQPVRMSRPRNVMNEGVLKRVAASHSEMRKAKESKALHDLKDQLSLGRSRLERNVAPFTFQSTAVREIQNHAGWLRLLR
jgi:hypothetical protein